MHGKRINYDDEEIFVAVDLAPSHLNLELFLIKAVFEAHEDWGANAVDVSVFHHCNHSIAIHRLSGEELKILEASQDVFHNCIAGK
jgi:hypothetical protein